MDTKALVDHVFSKTRLRITEADPVFALVALNEAILTALLTDLLAQQETASGEFLSEIERRITELSSVAGTSHRAIAEYVTAAKQDIERSGKSVAEAVREGAKAAGIDGAVQGYIGVEKKAIAQIGEATTELNKKLEALQASAEALKAAAGATEKPASGVSLAGLLVALAVAVGAVLGGVWLMQKAPTDPAVAFFQSLTPDQQTQVWRVLPHDAQVRINQAYQQAKQ